MKKIQLSDHFTTSKILLFALPSIGMQLVDNTYQVADGYFISNYIGASEFAAENLIFPPMAIVAAIGLMFGSGASALISYEQGRGNETRGNRLLSMLIAVMLTGGILISALLFGLMPGISRMVGASEEMIPFCVEYGRILACFMPFMLLNMAFHPLLVAAERPGLGFAVSVVNAIINIALDGLLVAVLGQGLKGAALATGIAWMISALIPGIYFLRTRTGLRFERPVRDGKALLKAMYNGASEMLDAISYAIVALVFNLQLMRIAGEAGVDAYAVTEYVGGVFQSVFYGVGMSITPVVGYHLGENNRQELRSIWKNGVWLMTLTGLLCGAACFGLARPIAGIFVGYDSELMRIAVEALRFTAAAYLIGGVTVFGSSFYTGLNDGTTSLILSGTRSFVLPLLFAITLPAVFQIRGLWLANPTAEIITLFLLLALTLRKKDRPLFYRDGQR